MANKPKHGQFYWTDLTVENPADLKDFYKEIFGWQEMHIPMKDNDEKYVDYAMAIDPETPGGGICHHRGTNTGIPPQWIPYFYVNDTTVAVEKAISLGGKILKESRKADGSYNYAILQDPQGTVFGVGNM